MARLKSPAWLKRLQTALVDGLRQVGITARVDHEVIQGTQLCRVYVIAEGFKPLQHSERQSLVWRLTERAISPEEHLRVSMILTLTPEELGDNRRLTARRTG
jgi:hypothetical protein